MCMEICGDNRFEIIDKAKKAIIERTNIERSPDEMKVLNDFLFRAWQMDWLKKYDDSIVKRRIDTANESQRNACLNMIGNEGHCEICPLYDGSECGASKDGTSCAEEILRFILEPISQDK